MNYIIFDLEWNQCCGGRDMENPRMPFEIIEIGAVKLDKKFNIMMNPHFERDDRLIWCIGNSSNGVGRMIISLARGVQWT